MDINELKDKLPNELLESLKNRGIEKLTPPQELAIKNGLLESKNIVISAPTASGKTLIAEIAMIKTTIWNKKKAVYIAPMRALVSEKFDEFKKSYPFLKVALSIGDLDSLDPWLESYDLIFLSTEKFDSLIRHGISWLNDIGCIVIDEIHMLDDYERGATLEILITRLKRSCKNAQLIGLSATIKNADEIADWLDAKLVVSDYRPVPLYKGVLVDNKVIYGNGEENLLGTSKNSESRIVEDTLERNKQILIFYATRRNAEKAAERLSEIVEKYLNINDKKELEDASKKVLNVLSNPTKQCEALANLIKKGIAFHHSGLLNEQRHIVEEYFRKGFIKAICATTTLSLGVNLPAFTVLVKDTIRYSDYGPTDRLSVNEVIQLFGRAGRPAYDKYGRALILARDSDDVPFLFDQYINNDPEPISSKLGILPLLRTHILALIASGFVHTEEALINFLTTTFYGYQFGSNKEFFYNIREIIDELISWNFVEKRGSILDATKIGKRVSELYIDPITAKWIIDTLPKIRDDLSALFMITNTLEMRPYVKEIDDIVLLDNYSDLIDFSFNEEPEKAFSTALMLFDWINEKKENEITEKYNITPGNFFNKINNADWLLYSAIELAKLIKINTTKLIILRARVKYGVKEELLDLVRLDYVGRVRARAMYINGIKSVKDLNKENSLDLLSHLFGKEIAEKIIKQVSN